MNITKPLGNCFKPMLLPLALVWAVVGCGSSANDGSAEKCFYDDDISENLSEAISPQVDLPEDNANVEFAAAAQDEQHVIPQEPNGLARLLVSESFDNCAFSTSWNETTVALEYYPDGEQPFVQMEGHSCVLQQYIPAGVDDITMAQVGMSGADAFQQITGSPDADEFYVEWQELYPEDHDFADAAQKLLRFVYSKEDEPRGAQFNLQALDDNSNLQLSWYHPDGIDAAWNTHLSIPVGRWVTFGVWCKLNTPGESDGFSRFYLDGEQVANVENLNNRGNDDRGWNNMWVGGNHTNHGLTVQASRRFIDNIQWWSSKP
jgi:hypothetical protein